MSRGGVSGRHKMGPVEMIMMIMMLMTMTMTMMMTMMTMMMTTVITTTTAMTTTMTTTDCDRTVIAAGTDDADVAAIDLFFDAPYRKKCL